MEEAGSREIREFWNTQAEQFGADPRATTPDHWLREIEISAVSRALSSLSAGSTVLDIGCGNGYSTLRLAIDHPSLQFVGGDYAHAMIAQAREALGGSGPDVQARVRFDEMDVLAIGEDAVYDVVVSDRCLINLPSFDLQRRAVDQIAAALKPDGLYVAVENFLGPHERLNEQRVTLGLEPIPIRWHNTYLDEEQFIEYCAAALRDDGGRADQQHLLPRNTSRLLKALPSRGCRAWLRSSDLRNRHETACS